MPLKTKLGYVDPFVPLQAADWLAYEAFRLLKSDRVNADRATWRWPMRQFFGRMQGVPGYWLPFQVERVKDDLAALDSGKPAPVVLSEWLDKDTFF